MVDLNPIESLVLQAIKDLGATTDEKKKTADDIAKKCNRPISACTCLGMRIAQKHGLTEN